MQHENNRLWQIVLLFVSAAIVFSACQTSTLGESGMEAEYASPGVIRLNEAASAGAFEFIELHNTSDDLVVFDASWVLDDNGLEYPEGARALRIPAGITIPAEGYLIICPFIADDINDVLNNELIPDEAMIIQSFSLNNADTVTLYFGDDPVDSISWDTDVNSIGKIGGTVQVLSPTPGEPNLAEAYLQEHSSIVINEINTLKDDYIELYNKGSEDILIGDNEWSLEDIQKDDSIALPESVIFRAGTFMSIFPNRDKPVVKYEGAEYYPETAGFGLGNNDTLFLRKDGKIADSRSWATHAASAGRLPDGSDTWVEELTITIGQSNRE